MVTALEPKPQVAWLSLGSNVGDRVAMLRSAIRRLSETPHIHLEAVSTVFETPPWGDENQSRFLNAALAVRTTLAPHELLDRAKAVEQALGRVPTRRWGPRVIDIDIIHMDGVALDDERLTLPHRHWQDRAFVLVPLVEIAPDLVIEGRSVSRALESCDTRDIVRIEGLLAPSHG